MSNNTPQPAPPSPNSDWKSGTDHPGGDTNIVDMRDSFARKTPPNAEEVKAANAFIDGKIEMIRKDSRLTDLEKTTAITDLESRRPKGQ
jgi:hypothetical protein